MESLDLDARQEAINEDLAQELERYKALLEESQMQQFELSKQTRGIVAEKESEIRVLKLQAGTTNATVVDPLTFSAMTEVEQFRGERETMLGNLEAAEQKLRDSLREKNEAKVAAAKLGDLKQRFDALLKEHTVLVTECESREKSKTETVDNLVQEYSALASEFELRSVHDAAHLVDLAKQNEILTTKLKNMEHSLTELADRAVSAPPPTLSTSSSTAGAAAVDGAETAALRLQLSELSSTVLHLESDVNSKAAQIEELMATKEEHRRKNALALNQAREDAESAKKEAKELHDTLAELQRTSAAAVAAESARQSKSSKENAASDADLERLRAKLVEDTLLHAAEIKNVTANLDAAKFALRDAEKEKTAAEAEHEADVQALQRKADEALGKLEIAHAAGVEALKEELETSAQLRLDAAQKAADERIAVAEAARDKAVWDQTHVEERYEIKMSEALAAADVQFKAELQSYIDKYSQERQRRKQIHNKLLELQGNIRVICRVRPVLEMECKHAAGDEIDVTEFPTEEEIVITKDPSTKTKFEYGTDLYIFLFHRHDSAFLLNSSPLPHPLDRVFAPGSTQEAVFASVAPLCTSVLDG